MMTEAEVYETPDVVTPPSPNPICEDSNEVIDIYFLIRTHGA
jgi:hypothetical protein